MYLDAEHFITLEDMGDGVTEFMALIVDLCLGHNKVFIIEEPEVYLHPAGIKANPSADWVVSPVPNSAAARTELLRELPPPDALVQFVSYKDKKSYR